MLGLYFEVEHKPRPLVDPLPSPRHSEWLAHHHEPAQKFVDYLSAHPIRKNDKLPIIYLCLVGDITEPKRRILERTQDYLVIFFDCSVKVRRKSALTKLKPFCQQNGLAPESIWCKQTTAAWAKGLDEERSAI